MVQNMHYETIDLSITMIAKPLSLHFGWVFLFYLQSFEGEYEVKPIAYKHQGIRIPHLKKMIFLRDILVVLGNSGHIEALAKGELGYFC